MADIVNDKTPEIIEETKKAVKRALKRMGSQAEKYAKALCPVGTVESVGKKGYIGGTLRNSITHKVTSSGSLQGVSIGSNVVYAPFVELGTGPFFVKPPDWESFEPYKKKGGAHGYVRPRPFLRPALKDHLDEYKKMLEDELKNI